MITKRYLFDLNKWEVVVLAEKAKDDRLLARFDTEAEANAAIIGFTHA
jgi:hypothetical protein